MVIGPTRYASLPDPSPLIVLGNAFVTVSPFRRAEPLHYQHINIEQVETTELLCYNHN